MAKEDPRSSTHAAVDDTTCGPTELAQGEDKIGEQAVKKDRLVKALDSMIYMPHIKEIGKDMAVPGLMVMGGGLRHNAVGDVAQPGGGEGHDGSRKRVGRPWDRGELYSRLQTFKSLTWFAKPPKINAQECARRGWENTGMDELTCETCRSVIKFPVSFQDDSFDVEPDQMRNVVDSFEKKLTEAHETLCPWRSSVCCLSLFEFPRHLPQATIAADFKSRCTVLRRLLCLPPMAESGMAQLVETASKTVGMLRDLHVVLKKGDACAAMPRKDWEDKPEFSEDVFRTQMMKMLRTHVVSNFEREAFLARVHLMALCGWSLRILKGASTDETDLQDLPPLLPEHTALQCTVCGARVGMWSMFEGCAAKAFSKAALAEKRAPLYQNDKISFSMNHQVAMNMTTTIAGGMLQPSVLGMAGESSGPFGKSSPGAFEYGTPPAKQKTSKKRPLEEGTENTKAKKQHTQRKPLSSSSALSQYRAACNADFDPVESHRPFCPWVHATSVNSSDSLCGWQIYLENLVSTSGDVSVASALASQQEDHEAGQKNAWRGKDVFHKVLSSITRKKS
ncbi:hypothetical protein M9435_001011 [Picochlorum sp. BPE23]|nr:hypothetical protein M9435_001011 [Picochlorum sp. BPE23]